MIYGNFEKNVYVFYPKNENEINFLSSKGFKKGYNNEFFKIVAVNDIKNINSYEEPKAIKKYYEDEFIKSLSDNSSLFFYTIAKDGRLLKVVGGIDNIEIFKQTISLGYNIELDKIFNQSYFYNSIDKKLNDEYLQVKQEITSITSNNANLNFVLQLTNSQHNYNNELKNESLLSLNSDKIINNVLRLLINDINNKNEIIKELITKLSTNPAVSGTPILLPDDLTALNQKLNNAFNSDKNILQSIITNDLKGYYNAKQ